MKEDLKKYIKEKIAELQAGRRAQRRMPGHVGARDLHDAIGEDIVEVLMDMTERGEIETGRMINDCYFSVEVRDEGEA